MEKLRQGSVVPEFLYSTPYQEEKSFYQLLQGPKPVLLVFLRNFGHPLSRHYIMEYVKTAGDLKDARLVCVVRTKPQVIADAIPEGSLPYGLICDEDGELYGFFGVQQEKRWFRSYSLKALSIFRGARKQGYVEKRSEPQQLPLTAVVGAEGRVLFAHYGESITDVPDNCLSMQRVMDELKADRPLGLDCGEEALPEQDSIPEPESIPPMPDSEQMADAAAVLYGGVPSRTEQETEESQEQESWELQLDAPEEPEAAEPEQTGTEPDDSEAAAEPEAETEPEPEAEADLEAEADTEFQIELPEFPEEAEPESAMPELAVEAVMQSAMPSQAEPISRIEKELGGYAAELRDSDLQTIGGGKTISDLGVGTFRPKKLNLKILGYGDKPEK